MKLFRIFTEYPARTVIIISIIFLAFADVSSPVYSAAKRNSYSYIRIFYFRDGKYARASLFAHPGLIDVLAPQAYSLNNSLELIGSVKANILIFAKNHKIKIMPLVTNGKFSQEVYQSLLDDVQKQDAVINAIVTEARKNGYWGWQFDFEQMNASWKDKYSAFIGRAAGVLKQNNLILSVAVIAQVSGNPNDYPNNAWQKVVGVYDYPVLANSADFISIMSYDDPESTGPVVEYPWLKRVLDYTLKLIPHEKLSMGIPLYYWQWNNETGARIGIGGRKGIYNVLAKHEILTNYDSKLEAAYLTYWHRSKQYTIWYENAKSIAKKIELIVQYRLHGFSAWALGLELPSIFTAVKK